MRQRTASARATSDVCGSRIRRARMVARPRRGGKRNPNHESDTTPAYSGGQWVLNTEPGLNLCRPHPCLRQDFPMNGGDNLLDDDLVAPLQVDVCRGAGRQLEHAVRAPHEPHDAVPTRQLAVDLLHPFLAVQEYGVDR